MNEEPKDNIVNIQFICDWDNQEKCVYFKQKCKTNTCKHYDVFTCKSAVAQVNKMVAELKKRGIEWQHQN
jgi:hypothetical protein